MVCSVKNLLYGSVDGMTYTYVYMVYSKRCIVYGMWYMVYTWALKGLLYHDFGACVCTILVIGTFGIQISPSVPWDFLGNS